MNIEKVPISILTPTYNRSKFLPLYIDNLINLEYPHELLEIVIDDDGKEPFIKNLDEFKKTVFPMKVNYIRKQFKRTIGEKRNNLIKNAKSKIICFMDDDDIYHPCYIDYSYSTMKTEGASCVGSNQMIFCYPFEDFKMTYIRCEKKFQIHEATMMMTKRYWKNNSGFSKSSKGEGAKIIGSNDKNVFVTDIRLIMICLAHQNNTVNKDMFNQDRNDLKQKYLGNKKDIIKNIFII